MKRFNFFVGLIISSMVLFAVSCANPNSIENQNPAKLKRSQIVNVTFDPNGGAQIPRNVYDYALGSTPGTEMPVARRAGYIFSGWNTKADGSGTVFNKNTVVLDSITVYAQWIFKTNPFTIHIGYKEDKVTITNLDSLPNTATVAMYDTQITITATPLPEETPYYDFVGYYDINSMVKICDKYGNLIPNTPYTDSYGQWICDLDYEALDLYIVPDWAQNIKATSVTLDQTVYNPRMGETFTVTGHYEPADATITITNPFENYYWNYSDLLITKDLICDNGTFSIEFKALKKSSESFTFACVKYPATTATCTINVLFPDTSTLATLPSISAVSTANSSGAGTGIGHCSSDSRYDFTGYDFDSNTVSKMYKVNLSAGKKYIFEMADNLSTRPSGIENFIDGLITIYDQSGNICYFYSGVPYLDDGEDSFTPYITGTYYVDLSRLNIFEKYEGFAGFHIYLDCITDLTFQLYSDNDPFRYNYILGTYYFKPLEYVDFIIGYSPNYSASSPTVWLDATVSDTNVISLDKTHINSSSGSIINLGANKIGSTEIIIEDDYSGLDIRYGLEVITDGNFTSFDTSSSTDYNDYVEMSFTPGIDSVMWYKLSLTNGHGYSIETGNNVPQIQAAISTEEYTDVSVNIYDSDFNLLAQNITQFSCSATGDYYVKFIPADDTDTMNAFHIYDMGEINTSIALSSETLNITAGGYTDITLIFNNGDPAVSSNFICSLDDNNQDDNSGITRFVTVEPYKSSPGDITINGDSNGQFTFTGEPSKIRIRGVVPGTTKLIFTDENAQITKEVNITVKQSALDGTLDLKKEAASSTTSNLADFYNEEFSSAKLYTVYSVSMLEGVTYYFQSLDEDSAYYFAEDLIDAHFYLEDSNNNIVAFNDSNQTTAYTCPATGTYYFVCTYRNINSAASYTGYAGVRWFAEKITLGELTSPWVVTAGSSADLPIPYTPSDGYYDDLFVATFNGSRIISNATVPPGSKFVTVQAIAPGSATIELEDDYTSTARQYPVTIVPPANKVIPVTINTSAPADVSDISAVQNVQIADLYNNNYVIYSIDMVKGATYNIITADSDKRHGLSNLNDCYFYLEGPDFNIISLQDNFTSSEDNFYSYTCTESGTYYMLVVPRTSGTLGTTAGAVLVFVEGISSLTAVSDMELPIFTSTAVNLSFTPSTAIYDFTVTSSNNRIKCTMNGSTLNIESLGIVQGYGSEKDVFPQSTVTVTDNISGKSFSFIVQTSYDPANTITITPGTSFSTDPADYNIVSVDITTLVQVYKVELTGGKTYIIELADVEDNQGIDANLEDSFLHMYDSNYLRVGYIDKGFFGYTPSGTGIFTYYIGLTSYFNDSTVGGVYIISVD